VVLDPVLFDVSHFFFRFSVVLFWSVSSEKTRSGLRGSSLEWAFLGYYFSPVAAILLPPPKNMNLRALLTVLTHPPPFPSALPAFPVFRFHLPPIPLFRSFRVVLSPKAKERCGIHRPSFVSTSPIGDPFFWPLAASLADLDYIVGR